VKLRLLRLAPLAVLLVLAALVQAFSDVPSEHLDPHLSFATPSVAHPLGCGEAGVDLLRVVTSAALSGIGLACVVALVGFGIGTPLGAAAAMARGRSERAVARACDLVQAFPSFLLAMAVLSAVRSPSRVHLGVVFALTAWAPFARLALAETRVLRGAGFVEAARALGLQWPRVLLRHVLPNLLPVLAVQLGATGAALVVSEAALSFVGLGPRGASLGSVLDQGVASMLRAPHVLCVGAVSVLVASASLLVAGRAADARSRGTR
jgi:peptide/nickel transport system permease protein